MAWGVCIVSIMYYDRYIRDHFKINLIMYVIKRLSRTYHKENILRISYIASLFFRV